MDKKVKTMILLLRFGTKEALSHKPNVLSLAMDNKSLKMRY